MKLVAGIDSSTQSCTVVLRDLATGATVATFSSPHPPTTPPVSEQHPESWWSALQEAFAGARRIVETEVSASYSIEGISVAAQAHGLVILDDRGDVIRPAKLWNDTTSAPENAALRAQLDPQTWVETVGSVPPAAFTLGKLAWIARHEPANFARIAQVMQPHDWLTMQLTGEAVTDPGSASGTGYYSPSTGQWALEPLRLIDADIDWARRLPRLISADETAGQLSTAAGRALDLPDGIPIGPGSADNQTAALGLGLAEGDVVVSVGTSGVLYASTDVPVLDLTGQINGNADASGGWLPVWCTLNGAKVLDTFARLLAVDHAQLSELALQAPVSDPHRPVLAAYLDGERVPDRPQATGTLAGLDTSTSREQLARAAYEGVLAGLVRGLDVFRDAGIPCHGRLAITGGGAKSPACRQLLADLTGRAVHVVEQAEAPAAGAAVQAAAIASGPDMRTMMHRWAPRWDAVAHPRPGTEASDLMARYQSVARWSGLERTTKEIPCAQ